MVESFLLGNGVELKYIPNNRFHTSLVSFNFFVKLSKETVSSYALLASILTTCSAEYKDFRALNLKLNSLYGADISSSVSKVGDNLCLKFSVSTINDEYAFGGDKPVSESVKLLMDLLFEPKCENGLFDDSDIKREKRMLIERIKGDLNNKRLYARKRLIEEMFDDQPYGVYRYGDIESIEKVSSADLYSTWNTLLKTAVVKINVVGKILPKQIIDYVNIRFSSVDRSKVMNVVEPVPATVRKEVKTVTDTMQVAQGKLVMGFNCESGDDSSSVATLVMCDLFGGGPYSKLFVNVREKMSLCYYCSSSSFRNKGFFIVDSGVESSNANKAMCEILNQFDAVKNGEFDDGELKASKISLDDSIMTSLDSLSGIDSWYTSRALNKTIYSPEQLCDLINSVSREDVINAASKVRLNTVYMLMPKEENA